MLDLKASLMKDYRLLQLLQGIKLNKNFVIDHGLKGIDRVVENGRAADTV